MIPSKVSGTEIAVQVDLMRELGSRYAEYRQAMSAPLDLMSVLALTGQVLETVNHILASSEQTLGPLPEHAGDPAMIDNNHLVYVGVLTLFLIGGGHRRPDRVLTPCRRICRPPHSKISSAAQPPETGTGTEDRAKRISSRSCIGRRRWSGKTASRHGFTVCGKRDISSGVTIPGLRR